MSIRGIDHIGIAVEDLDRAVGFFESVLDTPCSGFEEITEQGVRVAIFKFGTVKVELLASLNHEGSLTRFIERNGQGVHHLAFLVDDTDQALEALADKGIGLIDEKSKIGSEGLSVGFLHPKDTLGILMELCSNKRD